MWRNSPNRAQTALLLRCQCHSRQTHRPGRTPLYLWSARRRGRYLHITQQTQDMKIHVLCRFRNRNSNSQTVSDLLLRSLFHLLKMTYSQPFIHVWCGVNWRDLCEVILFGSSVKWVTLKFLGIKVPRTIGWPYTEGTWLYCDCFICCVSCTVVVLTCIVICGCVYMWVFSQLCGCFGNMCTCIYYVFVLFRLCIFSHICYYCK